MRPCPVNASNTACTGISLSGAWAWSVLFALSCLCLCPCEIATHSNQNLRRRRISTSSLNYIDSRAKAEHKVRNEGKRESESCTRTRMQTVTFGMNELGGGAATTSGKVCHAADAPEQNMRCMRESQGRESTQQYAVRRRTHTQTSTSGKTHGTETRETLVHTGGPILVYERERESNGNLRPNRVQWQCHLSAPHNNNARTHTRVCPQPVRGT